MAWRILGSVSGERYGCFLAMATICLVGRTDWRDITIRYHWWVMDVLRKHHVQDACTKTGCDRGRYCCKACCDSNPNDSAIPPLDGCRNGVLNRVIVGLCTLFEPQTLRLSYM